MRTMGGVGYLRYPAHWVYNLIAWLDHGQWTTNNKSVVKESRKDTYPFQSLHSSFATAFWCVARNAQWILQNGLSHFFSASSIERTLVKHQFIGGNTEAPPINLPRITLLANNLGCHICHASRDTGVQASFWVVNSHIEVGNVGVSCRIQ